jgi:uncharacterized membrane protein YhaH (DUF805 family)
MKSPFSLSSFIIGLIVFVPAVIITVATLIDASESHPLSVIGFPIIAIANIPEMPIGDFVGNIGFPIVLPTIAVVLGILGIRKNEQKKRLAVSGIALVAVSIAMYLGLRMVG